MITIENIINYIKTNINSFDFCGPNVVTNKKIVINNRYEGNRIEIFRYDESFGPEWRLANIYVGITIRDYDEEQYEELNSLFKSIEKRIKKEIEFEILDN